LAIARRVVANLNRVKRPNVSDAHAHSRVAGSRTRGNVCALDFERFAHLVLSFLYRSALHLRPSLCSIQANWEELLVPTSVSLLTFER
jgi:hypothetical protein